MTYAGASTSGRPLRLAFGLEFRDLYRREGLLALDAQFLQWLDGRDAALAEQLRAARERTDA